MRQFVESRRASVDEQTTRKSLTTCSHSYCNILKRYLTHFYLSCKCGYIREDELIEQLTLLIDKIDLNELGLKHKFHEEVARYNRFQRNVLKISSKEKSESDIDMKTYAKYILKEGMMEEKRELLSCMKSRILMNNKVLMLEKDDSNLNSKNN